MPHKTQTHPGNPTATSDRGAGPSNPTTQIPVSTNRVGNADAAAVAMQAVVEDEDDLDRLPESDARIQACLDSASYWAVALPKYANQMQGKADFWAFAAGILAVITGLAVWATVAQSADIWAQAAVTLVAVLAGICALVPRVRNYAEMAGAARELAPRIQHSFGLLCNLWREKELFSMPIAHKVVDEFEALNADKRRLRYLPDRPSRPPSRDEYGIAVWASEGSGV